MPVNHALVQRCIEYFLQKWRDCFPGATSVTHFFFVLATSHCRYGVLLYGRFLFGIAGVEPARFAGKPEPAPTGAISVDQWNGFITIGMAEQYEDKGLSGEISNLQANMVQSRDLFQNCMERLRGCKEEKTQEKLTMHKRRRPWRTRSCS